MDNKDIGKAIKNSVIDVIDHGVNLASDSEIIQEIPVIKYIASINNISEAYQSRKLHKNVLSFLEAVRDKDQEVEVEEENLDEFIDTLSLILIESEKPIKTQIIGNLTRAYGQKVFNFTTFNHLCLLVHSSSIPALYNFALLANPEMLAAIDKLEATHSSMKTDGLAPNISTRIVGVHAVTPFLATLGVLDHNGYLNGYGMALVKYGSFAEIEQQRMDIFKEKENATV